MGSSVDITPFVFKTVITGDDDCTISTLETQTRKKIACLKCCVANGLAWLLCFCKGAVRMMRSNNVNMSCTKEFTLTLLLIYCSHLQEFF